MQLSALEKSLDFITTSPSGNAVFHQPWEAGFKPPEAVEISAVQYSDIAPFPLKKGMAIQT